MKRNALLSNGELDHWYSIFCSSTKQNAHESQIQLHCFLGGFPFFVVMLDYLCDCLHLDPHLTSLAIY